VHFTFTFTFTYRFPEAENYSDFHTVPCSRSRMFVTVIT